MIMINYAEVMVSTGKIRYNILVTIFKEVSC